MRLTVKLGAAIGIAALGACTQSGQDNSAATDVNSVAAGEETVLPPDEGNGSIDTLGNQLDQLNESDQAITSEAANETNSE
jgi:hypothetical protein